jgi:hypothetical protein
LHSNLQLLHAALAITATTPMELKEPLVVYDTRKAPTGDMNCYEKAVLKMRLVRTPEMHTTQSSRGSLNERRRSLRDMA